MTCAECNQSFPLCLCDNWNERLEDLKACPCLKLDITGILGLRIANMSLVNTKRRMLGRPNAVAPVIKDWWKEGYWRLQPLPDNQTADAILIYKGVQIYRRGWGGEKSPDVISIWFNLPGTPNRRGGFHCLPTEEALVFDKLLNNLDAILSSEQPQPTQQPNNHDTQASS